MDAVANVERRRAAAPPLMRREALVMAAAFVIVSALSLVLIGLVIERNQRLIRDRVLLFALIAAQLISARVFWSIQAPATRSRRSRGPVRRSASRMRCSIG